MIHSFWKSYNIPIRINSIISVMFVLLMNKQSKDNNYTIIRYQEWEESPFRVLKARQSQLKVQSSRHPSRKNSLGCSFVGCLQEPSKDPEEQQ